MEYDYGSDKETPKFVQEGIWPIPVLTSEPTNERPAYVNASQKPVLVLESIWSETCQPSFYASWLLKERLWVVPQC